MRKIFKPLIALLCVAPMFAADAAMQIKKAAPVAVKESASGLEGGASLIGSVLGLVGNVVEMNSKQNALTADCIPSTAEMNFVDATMKEWAKTGQMTAEQAKAALKREPCSSMNCYALEVQSNGNVAGLAPKYNVFVGPGNDGYVWEGFPKTGKGTYCKSGAISCSGSDLITMSDTYDLFNLIDFGPADYTPTEATMAAKLLNKVENCSSAKLSMKKKEMWGEFLTTTMGNLGQKTNTGDIMQTVGSIGNSGGAGALNSIGGIATQFLNK